MSDEHIDCSQTMYRMTEYLDGEMTAEDSRQIAAHLTTCAPCLSEHDLDRMLKELVHRSCTQEQAPAQLRTLIMQRITTICDDGSFSEVTQVRRLSEG
ncbi:mycothiol system anti-sigma-R factor [Janibacter sp. GS2]|uniref:mycothiol system anti-sigma-R factor n=1 Tax=Janibacter sp. GS2 TaxID=3442646 RepID=UPI003EBC11A8